MRTELHDLAQTVYPQPVTQGPSAQAFLGGVGEGFDAQSELDREALKARYTDGAIMGEVCTSLGVARLPTTGDTERLRRLGAAKNVTRYASETDAQFEARIDSSLADLKLLTTVAGLKLQVRAFGIPDVAVVEECYSTLADPRASYGLRFVVVLGPNFGTLGWTPLRLPFVLGSSYLGVAGATPAQFSDLARIILAWKNAFAFPLALVCRFGNAPVLGAGLTLPFTLGGSSTAGYARRPIGEQDLLGARTLPFTLRGGYAV